MKLTQSKKVWEIVRPPIDGIPDRPAVSMTESVMHAVELMVKNDRVTIGVISSGRLVGHIQLAEALQHLGLRIPPYRPPAGNGPRAV
jgi:hypothetical protein